MSVALADLDNDDDLDLIAGNYNYPYVIPSAGPEELGEGEIGSVLIAYEWGHGTPPSDEYYTGVALTDEEDPKCIDCIAVGDYDSDNDWDILLGLVVGKPGSENPGGGVLLLENRFDPSVAIEDLRDLFDEDN